jgi:DNA polymerase
MLNKKQIKLLTLLDQQFKGCKKCTLWPNGTAKPLWNPFNRYAIIGEAPGYNEVKGREPFVGQAGEILTDNLSELGFKKSDFLIINSVNCRPLKSNRNANGKPTRDQLHACQPWIRKYLKVVNPEKILCLGNYAKYYFTNSYEGVMSQRGVFRQYKLDENSKSYPVLITVHPAYLIYNIEQGLPALQEDLKLFKKFENTVEENWTFKEEEFNIL